MIYAFVYIFVELMVEFKVILFLYNFPISSTSSRSASSNYTVIFKFIDMLLNRL